MNASNLDVAGQRAAVVAEALSWRGTPYVGNGGVKGAGVDCAMFPLLVFSSLGLVEFVDPRPYPMQWAIHQSSERYLKAVLTYTQEILGPPQPADLVMFKFGKVYSHGAIVIDWPWIIHANPPGECREENADMNSALLRLRKFGPPRFFSIWS